MVTNSENNHPSKSNLKQKHFFRDFNWSDWQPHQNSWLRKNLPSIGGIYRIREIDSSKLLFIGQTGSGTMSIKKRSGMLRNVYKKEMPYRTPHTAGPALWALRQQGMIFEISFIELNENIVIRKGLKEISIALYRQKHRESPLINFGRMPIGYYISSGNDKKLVAKNKRFRGGKTIEKKQNHLSGISPMNIFDANIMSNNWCGFSWSKWMNSGNGRNNRMLHSKTLGIYPF